MCKKMHTFVVLFYKFNIAYIHIFLHSGASTWKDRMHLERDRTVKLHSDALISERFDFNPFKCRVDIVSFENPLVRLSRGQLFSNISSGIYRNENWFILIHIFILYCTNGVVALHWCHFTHLIVLSLCKNWCVRNYTPLYSAIKYCIAWS